MISITVVSDDHHYSSLTCTGHAEYDEYGLDIVCAAVSAVVFGLNNAMDEMLGGIDTTIEDNLIKIEIPTPDEKSDEIMTVGLIQLKTIQESYGDHIRIKNKRGKTK